MGGHVQELRCEDKKHTIRFSKAIPVGRRVCRDAQSMQTFRQTIDGECRVNKVRGVETSMCRTVGKPPKLARILVLLLQRLFSSR